MCKLNVHFGKLNVQGKPLVRAGVELAQDDDFPATLTNDIFAKNMKFPPRVPEGVGGSEGALVDG